MTMKLCLFEEAIKVGFVSIPLSVVVKLKGLSYLGLWFKV